MGINIKSLKNLNPGKKIAWNDLQFNSIREMSEHVNIPKSTLQERLKKDVPILGHYADELF